MRIATEHSVRNFDNLPGCAQVCVSHGLFLKLPSRRKGLGRPEFAKAVRAAKELGYDFYMCTVRADNTRQLQILREAGMLWMGEFLSSRTGAVVQLYGRQSNVLIDYTTPWLKEV